jgi:LPXTG-site transpeptidase (sortase) family protein
MRLGLRLTGNVLIVVSLLGLVGIGVLLVVPEQGPPQWLAQVESTFSPPGLVAGQGARSSLVKFGPGGRTRTEGGLTGVQAGDNGTPLPLRPITHVGIDSIDLSVDVVAAGLIERDGGLTWEVPAFKVGHAEGTAGAGQIGNGVLLGHVTSLRSGNVFQDLDRVQVGDAIGISADDNQFEYRVVSKMHVPRSDTSVAEQGDVSAVSLITCTGMWLPTIWDYTERLVVRAELVHTP